ncbi:MAG: hypothetical protein ABEJ56_03085, partial [Candidatus Nanohaloarchaea archaeon]
NKMASWDKFLSFIVAVTFLWVGLNVVQSMDLEGPQKKAAGKAKGMMKSAATYLPGKAYGRAKETASDYATLAGEKTKLNRLPIVGSQSAGRMKRKEAVEQVRRRQQARERGIREKARAPGKGGGGLAGTIAPSYESIAKEEITASNLQSIRRRQERERKEETKEEAREFEEPQYREEIDRQAQERGFDNYEQAQQAAESDTEDFDDEDLEELELEAAGNVGQGGINELKDFFSRAIPGLEDTSRRGMHMKEAEVTEKHLKELENYLGSSNASNSELSSNIRDSFGDLTEELDKSLSERDRDKITRLRQELAKKLPQAINRGMKDEMSDILSDEQSSAPSDAFEQDPQRAMLAMKHGEDYSAVDAETNSELKDDLGDIYDSSLHSMNMAGDSDISSAIIEEESDKYNFSEYSSGAEGTEREEMEEEAEAGAAGGGEGAGAAEGSTQETRDNVRSAGSSEELRTALRDLENEVENLREEIRNMQPDNRDDFSENDPVLTHDGRVFKAGDTTGYTSQAGNDSRVRIVAEDQGDVIVRQEGTGNVFHLSDEESSSRLGVENKDLDTSDLSEGVDLDEIEATA